MSTMKTVAELAGVSTATVSRVLTDPDVVLPATREKVRKAIAELGYTGNAAAKNLRTLRTAKIVVMVPDVANPFFAEVLRGAEDAAQEAGYSVLLGDTRDNPAREDQYAAMVPRKEADGAIFLGPRLPEPLRAIVSQRGSQAPVVNGCDFSPAFGVAGVYIDNNAAARRAMELLYDAGHRRIGVIAGPDDSHITRARLEGVYSTAQAMGASDTLHFVTGDYSIKSGREATRTLLALPHRPTAIFSFSDEMAVGALAMLRESGVSCPDDMSIVGFDDIRYSEFLEPALTTVRQPMNAIGRTAVSLLLDIMESRSDGIERVELDHELISRGSVARRN